MVLIWIKYGINLHNFDLMSMIHSAALIHKLMGEYHTNNKVLYYNF